MLDDFSNSSPVSLERVQELSGKTLQCVQGDVRDATLLEQLFADANATDHPIEAVVHFAGLKAVGESVKDPLRYWDVNMAGSRTLLSVMDSHDCHILVFSSSATVYGYPEVVPIPETAPIRPINPYGHSKAAVEQILRDLSASAPEHWRIASLRYFNPVGAHPSGRMGEDPNGIPNNLFPYITQVAIGTHDYLKIFGGDWPTADGSGIRDYIHVMDLAEGHCAALDYLLSEEPQVLTLNLGSGHGTSVLEAVQAFERASDRPIPYKVTKRRSGDAAITVADPALAEARLGWRTREVASTTCAAIAGPGNQPIPRVPKSTH